jgi:hypothetical protein
VTRAVRVASAAAMAIITTLLAGCSADPPERVPDSALLDAITSLDGVTSSTVEYRNVFGYGPRYTGEVTVSETADAACVLYQALGVLKQGRPGIRLSGVTVAQGGEHLALGDLSAEARSAVETTPVSSHREPVIPDCAGVALGLADVPADTSTTSPTKDRGALER